MAPKKISAAEKKQLLATLQTRFEKNKKRHPKLQWAEVEARIGSKDSQLTALQAMEETGGEPDVVGTDPKTGAILFFDCSPESPAGRRSFCYDRAALASRKEYKPKHSAVGLAAEMGIELLDENQYRQLQQLGSFDSKTSSWLKTPPEVRDLGGAIFGDFRFGRVFVYHNGAESYYAARGFRGWIAI